MIDPLKKALILSSVIACFIQANSAFAAKLVEQDQREQLVFKGIHWKRSVGGRPNTARITDGKTFIDVTEQEYRQRGYTPAFDQLNELMIQRLPVKQEPK